MLVNYLPYTHAETEIICCRYGLVEMGDSRSIVTLSHSTGSVDNTCRDFGSCIIFWERHNGGELAQWLASRTTDHGVPGSRPGRGTVCCSLEQVTFTYCLVLAQWLASRTTDHGVPGSRRGRGTVCCGLEQVTFTYCLVLVKPRKPWTDD